MSFRLSWAVEHRIILCQYIGHITLETVNEAARKAVPMVENGQQPIHFIMDVQEMSGLHYGVQEGASRQFPFDIHSIGWIVYVGSRENAFYQFMATALAQYHGLRMRWFETMQEALAFLKDVDFSLDDIDVDSPPSFDGL